LLEDFDLIFFGDFGNWKIWMDFIENRRKTSVDPMRMLLEK
jgi:hypothetical protein